MEDAGTREVLLVGLLALQLGLLYGCGAYASSRWLGAAGGSGVGRLLFYLFVMPGIVAHESAHALACVLTGTRIGRFAPFAPQAAADGRMILGYVEHARRPAPIMAAIGLAPTALNPLCILLITALLTPATAAEVFAGPLVATAGALEGGFAASDPLAFGLWAYLAMSFGVGAVPSREDLAAVPAAAAALLALGLLYLAYVRASGAAAARSEDLLAVAGDFAARASALYSLPTAIAVGAAVAVAAFTWLSRPGSGRVGRP